MKKNLIKLSILAEQALAEKEMAAIAGGDRKVCQCSCYYEGQASGASTGDNSDSNYVFSGTSGRGCNLLIKTDHGYEVIAQNHE